MEGREEEREEPECEGPDPLTPDTYSSPVNSDPQTLHPKDGDCSPDPDTDEAEDGDVPPTKANQKTSSVAHSKAGLADSKAELSSKIVPGIIYLGHIPPRLRPQQMRTMLSVYGTVGRIFLQPEDGQVRKKKKKAGHKRCDFTEGWVEFRDKRIAKRVALSLHNTPMGTRKRQHFSSDLWSIKYLHRFQWTHLSERLAYEQTVLHQRLRTEVSQAKRETNFYLNNVERSAAMTTKRRRGGEQEQKTWDFTQRQTEDEIQTRKKRKESVTQKPRQKDRLHTQQSQSNVSLLAKIFNSNKSD